MARKCLRGNISVCDWPERIKMKEKNGVQATGTRPICSQVLLFPRRRDQLARRERAQAHMMPSGEQSFDISE
jgi:hypothetical protein